MPKSNDYLTRYRINRVGSVIRDDRTFTAAFLDPDRFQYAAGMRIVRTRKPSPATVKYRADRKARRKIERTTAGFRAMKDAAVSAGTAMQNFAKALAEVGKAAKTNTTAYVGDK